MKDAKRLIDVAAGRQKAGLVFKNANVVNVFTGEILCADVAVEGDIIAGVGRYEGEEEIDCTDKYLCPGFIDAHIHIESTMVLPGELVRLILPSGTTTLVADPHEIVNVCGAKGMQFMLDASENLPCNIYYMLPSSVPATSFETAGADFTAADMAPFLADPRVLGLGEVMGFPGVVAGEAGVLEKIALVGERPVDGHAPGLTGTALQAYAAAGVQTEHECTTFAEAAEKARAGFVVLVREGSAAHNLSTIVNGLVDNDMPTGRFLFCTDDKHIEDIARDGHIRWNVKLAIELGMKPVDAIRMATLNPATAYGLKGLGAVAAGYRADLVLLKSLKQVEVEAVYKDGVDAAERLKNLPPIKNADPDVLHSMKARRVTAEDFALPVRASSLPGVAPPAAEIAMPSLTQKATPRVAEAALVPVVQALEHVIEMVPYQLATRHLLETVPRENGRFKPQGDYCKLAVVERHGRGGGIQTAPLKGYGIHGGAIATSVAHDSHNIIAAGDSDEDIALAVNRLGEIDGGYVLVQNGAVVGEVPLAVAGLMSTRSAAEVQQATGALIEKAAAMGIPYYLDPFISLSFLALPVIPELRLTDLGLFDVERFAMIES